jgi:hypothetical protein
MGIRECVGRILLWFLKAIKDPQEPAALESLIADGPLKLFTSELEHHQSSSAAH